MIFNKQFLQIFFIINLIPTASAYSIDVEYKAYNSQLVYVQEEGSSMLYSLTMSDGRGLDLYPSYNTFKNLKDNTTYKLFTPTCKNEVMFNLETSSNPASNKFHVYYFTKNFSQEADPHRESKSNVIGAKFDISDASNGYNNGFECTIKYVP